MATPGQMQNLNITNAYTALGMVQNYTETRPEPAARVVYSVMQAGLDLIEPLRQDLVVEGMPEQAPIPADRATTTQQAMDYLNAALGYLREIQQWAATSDDVKQQYPNAVEITTTTIEILSDPNMQAKLNSLPDPAISATIPASTVDGSLPTEIANLTPNPNPPAPGESKGAENK